MQNPRFNILVATSAILAPTAAQLIPPANLPALSQNFQLIAHVKHPSVTQFAAGIENWEVAALREHGCHQPLVLRTPQHRPDANRTSGTTFFFDPTTTQIQYEHGGKARSLLIRDSGYQERDVSVDCGQGTSGVGVADVDDGPQLVDASNGTFYVCPRRIRGEAAAQLLYRQGISEPLPSMCSDVVLFAKMASGSDHGDGSLVVCCTDVRDGVCVLPVRTGKE